MHAKVGPADPGASPPAHLVARLRRLVVDGVLALDEPLQVSRVAELLQIRETQALDVVRELGRDGFLECVDDGSVRVRAVEELVEGEVVHLRCLLEPGATRAAAEHARPADVWSLRDLADDVDAAVAARDSSAFRRADEAFHATLLRLHPNAELGRLLGVLRNRTPVEGLRAAVRAGELSARLYPHRVMVDLIEAGDGDGVERAASGFVWALNYVGAPHMDAPWLASRATVLEDPVDTEFLDAEFLDAEGSSS